MGKRGPAPMPTKLKILHGEKRPSRLNKREPKPKSDLPVMPPDMDKRSAQVWRRVIRDFGPTGVLTSVDGAVLRAYCEAVARYEHAATRLAEMGPLVRGARRGDLVKNPLHQIVRDNADLLRQMARELGLTPSARTGLQVGEGRGDVDPFEAWKSGSEAAQ